MSKFYGLTILDRNGISIPVFGGYINTLLGDNKFIFKDLMIDSESEVKDKIIELDKNPNEIIGKSYYGHNGECLIDSYVKDLIITKGDKFTSICFNLCTIRKIYIVKEFLFSRKLKDIVYTTEVENFKYTTTNLVIENNNLNPTIIKEIVS